MHKKFRGISILLIVIHHSALVFGQEQTLEKSAFREIVEKANSNLEPKFSVKNLRAAPFRPTNTMRRSKSKRR